MRVEKTVYLSGRLRPGGIALIQPADKSISVSTAEDGTVNVSIPLMLQDLVLPENRVELLLLADGKNWGSREPWKSGLLSPTLTILSTADDTASVKIEYQIPKFPDWQRSTVKSSIDGAVSILTAPSGLSGAITDQGSTLLKPNWSDTVFATIRLPAAGNTDYVWIEHEYLFGGTLNSLLTPLPAGTTTTTTTTDSTTTTAATTTTGATTTAATTTAATTTEATTTTTLPVATFSIQFDDRRDYWYAVRPGLWEYQDAEVYALPRLGPFRNQAVTNQPFDGANGVTVYIFYAATGQGSYAPFMFPATPAQLPTTGSYSIYTSSL